MPLALWDLQSQDNGGRVTDRGDFILSVIEGAIATGPIPPQALRTGV